MNKKNLTFLLCMFVLTSYSQKVNDGKYCYSFNTGFSSNCVTLNKNNKFRWETSGDMGTISEGKGVYEIKQGQLFLEFKKDTITYDSTAKIEKIEETDKEKVTLYLKLVDHYGQPLAAVDIVPENDTIHKYRTDLSGLLEIPNIQKSKQPVTFRTPNLLGFENYKFQFIPKSNTVILVTLHPQKPKIISDKTLVFEIITSSKEKLVLKNTSGQVQEFVRSN